MREGGFTSNMRGTRVGQIFLCFLFFFFFLFFGLNHLALGIGLGKFDPVVRS